MTQTAAHLTDRVFPEVPVRQWVVSFPPPLRYLLAYDAEITSAVLRITYDAIFTWLKRTAQRELGLTSARCLYPGGVTFIHRFGSALNLNLHPHNVFFDGVFVMSPTGDKPVFRATPAPSPADINAIAWEIYTRVTQLLQQRGRYFDAPPDEADTLAQDQPLLAACYRASLQGKALLGERAGQRLLTFGTPGETVESPNKIQSPPHGISIHAGVRIAAKDRKRLEKLLRYTCRPPLALSRLELTSSGKVTYQLKRPWSDGTTHIIYNPLDFISRLAALVPAPRVNLVRYVGVLAPNAKLRKAIVPKPSSRRAKRKPHQLELASSAKPVRDHPERYRFADLMRRTFQIDLDLCPECGKGPMVVLGVVTDPRVLATLLEKPTATKIQLSSHQARAPPPLQLELLFTLRSSEKAA